MSRKHSIETVIIALLFFSAIPYVHAQENMWNTLDALTAGFFTGNDLYRLRLTVAVPNQSIALGYVMGVHDSLKSQKIFCSPGAATGQQLLDVVFKYLSDHPGRRAEQAQLLVRDALRTNWPC